MPCVNIVIRWWGIHRYFTTKLKCTEGSVFCKLWMSPIPIYHGILFNFTPQIAFKLFLELLVSIFSRYIFPRHRQKNKFKHDSQSPPQSHFRGGITSAGRHSEHCSKGNIGSDNGLEPSDDKPLPQEMLGIWNIITQPQTKKYICDSLNNQSINLTSCLFEVFEMCLKRMSTDVFAS